MQHVVSMMKFRHMPLSEVVKNQEALWEQLARGHSMAQRRAMTSGQLAALGGFGFVVQWSPPKPARLRMAGAHLFALLRMDVHGMPLSSLIAPESRYEFGIVLRNFFTQQQDLSLTLRAENGPKSGVRKANLRLLPMQENNGGCGWGLGCLHFDVNAARVPTRFSISHISRKNLGCRSKTASTQRVSAGFAEVQAPFSPGPAPYLKLVHDSSESS